MSLAHLYQTKIAEADAQIYEEQEEFLKIAEEQEYAGRFMARGFMDELNKLAAGGMRPMYGTGEGEGRGSGAGGAALGALGGAAAGAGGMEALRRYTSRGSKADDKLRAMLSDRGASGQAAGESRSFRGAQRAERAGKHLTGVKALKEKAMGHGMRASGSAQRGLSRAAQALGKGKVSPAALAAALGVGALGAGAGYAAS